MLCPFACGEEKPPCQFSDRELTSKDESNQSVKLLRAKPVASSFLWHSPVEEPEYDT